MGTLLKLAWRNIWRNRRRTLISMSASGIGLLLIVLYSGLMEGIFGDAKNQMASTGIGHVEIYAPGYRASRRAGDALKDPRSVLAKLQLPAGARAAARVLARGLATTAHGSQAVEIHGVDPASEPQVAAYLRVLRAGAPLAADDARGILIGDKLAERLQLRVGQKVRLLVQRADGEMGADIYRVRGIFHSIAASLNKGQVIVTAAAAQTLLGLPDVAHQIVIQLANADDSDSVAQGVRAALGGGYDVVTYGDLMPMLRRLEKLSGTYMIVAAIFIYLLVGLGILNTMLMSVLERTREFGVMQAIGERPSGIRRIVLAEAFWIATISVAVGLTVGMYLTWLGSNGSLFDFSKSMGESIDMGGSTMSTAFRTVFSWQNAVRSASIVYVVTLFIGLVPAWRVSRLRPAVALRAT